MEYVQSMISPEWSSCLPVVPLYSGPLAVCFARVFLVHNVHFFLILVAFIVPFPTPGAGGAPVPGPFKVNVSVINALSATVEPETYRNAYA